MIGQTSKKRRKKTKTAHESNPCHELLKAVDLAVQLSNIKWKSLGKNDY